MIATAMWKVVLPGVLLAAVLALPAYAQDQAIQRELVLRQQQSDAFALQLRQSQQLQAIPAGDIRRRVEVETLQLQQRQDLDNLGARQLNEAAHDKPAELRPYERSVFEAQRRALLAPSQ